MDPNRLIGRGGELPWHLPADLRHFKALTLGHPVLMGRRTWESIGRPLPGRHNLVLSRDPGFRAPGAEVVGDLEAALAAAARRGGELMVIGGAGVYAQCLPLADRIHLTLVHHVFEGDTWFPELEAGVWRERAREERPPDAANPYALSFITLEREG